MYLAVVVASSKNQVHLLQNLVNLVADRMSLCSNGASLVADWMPFYDDGYCLIGDGANPCVDDAHLCTQRVVFATIR